jgi:lipopolysaccharide/colanic/teichoic acid biosynthesis glycosyltransferase
VNKSLMEKPGRWSRSIAKRLFDIACVVFFLPLWLPVLFFVAAAVRITSRGQIFFLQKRVGKGNELFTIVKFRTLKHLQDARLPAVTTTKSKCFTFIGPFLRHWKLDELPQMFNVFVGDMSLVGARPKLPEHQIEKLQCRPGITGAATVAFACEGKLLAKIPKDELDDFYREGVLPTFLI